MKKLIFLCVMALSSMDSFAQLWDNSKPDKRVTFGVRAGVNNSTYSLSVDKDWWEDNLKSRWGFHGGLNMDINFYKSFALETGLFYSEKGFKNEGFDKNVKMGFIQVPVQALTRLYLKDDVYLSAKAGGFVACAVKKEEYHKDVDAGLSFGAGIAIKKIFLGVQYELGLLSLDRDFSGGKTGNLAISIGYDF